MIVAFKYLRGSLGSVLQPIGASGAISRWLRFVSLLLRNPKFGHMSFAEFRGARVRSIYTLVYG
jgi:hypothetical protein